MKSDATVESESDMYVALAHFVIDTHQNFMQFSAGNIPDRDKVKGTKVKMGAARSTASMLDCTPCFYRRILGSASQFWASHALG